MLFPLSPSFNSSSLFQKGEHPDPVRKKGWYQSKQDGFGRTCSEADLQELHLILTQKRPYKPWSSQAALSDNRAEERRKQDVARARTFADQLREVSDAREEQAKARRQETAAEIQQWKRAAKSRGDDKMDSIRRQRAEYTKWREEAKDRIQQLPVQGGGRSGEGPFGRRIISELEDSQVRAKQMHTEKGEEIRKQTSGYMNSLRDMKERVETLPVQGGGQHNGAAAYARRIVPGGLPTSDEKRPDKGEEIRRQHTEYMKLKEDMKDRVQQLPMQGGGQHNGGTGDRRKIIPELASLEDYQDLPRVDKGDEIRTQQAGFMKWKEEMKGRVQQLPVQGGGRHNGESDGARKIVPESRDPARF